MNIDYLVNAIYDRVMSLGSFAKFATVLGSVEVCTEYGTYYVNLARYGGSITPYPKYDVFARISE